VEEPRTARENGEGNGHGIVACRDSDGVQRYSFRDPKNTFNKLEGPEERTRTQRLEGELHTTKKHAQERETTHNATTIASQTTQNAE
jgi:hypothetical protein